MVAPHAQRKSEVRNVSQTTGERARSAEKPSAVPGTAADRVPRQAGQRLRSPVDQAADWCRVVLDQYAEVWAVDFEFAAPPGEGPSPVCMVARELHSGRTIRLWRDQFGPAPPFSIGPETLFVAYYASAELGCFRVLGWRRPANILDLFTEFRDRTNGLELPAGAFDRGAHLLRARYDRRPREGRDARARHARRSLFRCRARRPPQLLPVRCHGARVPA